MKKGLRAFTALMMFMFSASPFAGQSVNSIHEYQIPNNGTLILDFPSSWLDGFGQPPEGLPPSISIGPKDGNVYLKITAFWNLENRDDFNTLSQLKSSTLEMGNSLLSGAVETETTLSEIEGKSSHGYYFTVTDAAPKAGEYQFMRQGFVAVGNLQLVFTLLSHEKSSGDILSALAIFENASKK